MELTKLKGRAKPDFFIEYQISWKKLKFPTPSTEYGGMQDSLKGPWQCWRSDCWLCHKEIFFIPGGRPLLWHLRQNLKECASSEARRLLVHLQMFPFCSKNHPCSLLTRQQNDFLWSLCHWQGWNHHPSEEQESSGQDGVNAGFMQHSLFLN